MFGLHDQHHVIQVQPHLATSVRRPCEDWSGLASPAERRQLQNRINARAYRQRHSRPKKKSASEKKASLDIIISFDSPAPSPSSTSVLSCSPATPSSPKTLEKLALRARIDVQEIAAFALISEDSNPGSFLSRFQKIFAAEVEYMTRHLPSPSTDLLLSVVSMNVLRAFARNLKVLGYNHIFLSQKEAISPFFTNSRGTASTLPTDLQPTTLQKAMLHHPIYDIFPDPILREQMLLCRGQYDHDALCWDLIGWPNTEHGDRDGLLVWGESYRTDSWEASEAFLHRHPALLPGCANLIASSNRWRISRGEPPLRI